MPLFEIPVIATIRADTFDDAVREAEAFVEGQFNDDEMGLAVYVGSEHDNNGQRVVYLHAENEPYND